MDPGIAAVVAASATAVVSLVGLFISLRSSRRQAEQQAREQAQMAREQGELAAAEAREQRVFYEQQVQEVLGFAREQIGAARGVRIALGHETLLGFRNWISDLDDWLANPPWTTEGTGQRVDELNALLGTWVSGVLDPELRDSFFLLRTLLWNAPHGALSEEWAKDYSTEVSDLAHSLQTQVEYAVKTPLERRWGL